ncbi:MAG: MFS transporter [Anaerolineales bacterium]|jgi:MFS family permease|nr:MFS transporter [Anaerolineales bacterium]
MAKNILDTYWARVSAFHPNARFYLVSAILTGAALGIYRLLFNFYVLSLGFDENLLGQLITITSLSALITALPMGYLADMLGRKNSFLLGGAVVAGSVAAMILWPSAPMFYAMNVLMGMAQGLQTVTMAPFLLENSGEEERTYLFSLSSGLQMAAAFVGNSIGGYLPSWIATQQNVLPTSSVAYAGALGIISVLALLGLIPLFWLRSPVLKKSERALFAPFAYARKHPDTLSKLLAPMLVTSIGAGLFMPFMNVFFRVAHGQPDPVIGNVLAWGALAMGIGLLIAPPLADRLGKAELVVITQGLSIPFLIMLGFAPWFWMSALGHYARLSLMNMSGPIYTTFVMEHVEPDSRATVASLVSMVNSFGWAFSPSISGWLQVNYGFKPVFGLVLVLYSLSVFMYWKFFWKVAPPHAAPETT